MAGRFRDRAAQAALEVEGGQVRRQRRTRRRRGFASTCAASGTLGEQTHLRFRYHVTGADAIQVALVNRKKKERHILDLNEMRKGAWTETTLDFTKQTRAGERVDEIQFLLPKGAELLVDDLLLYEPGGE